VPEAVCAQHPVLARVNATTIMQCGEAARLAAFLATAEPRLERTAEHEALGTLLSIHAQLSVTRDDPEGALAYAERALLVLPAGPTPYRALALGAIAQSHLLRGDPGSAGPILARMGAIVNRDMALVYWSHQIYAADRNRQMGELARGATGYRAVLEDIGDRNVFARHQALVGWSAIALEWNRLAEAQDALDRSREAQHLSGRTYQSIQPATLLQGARVLRARGQFAAARSALDQAEDAAHQQGSTRIERLARAERAWVALLDGRRADAEHWAETLDPSGLEAYAREPELLLVARVQRARGATVEVAPLLERLLTTAEQVGRTNSVIAVLVQLALTCEQVGDGSGALAALERAVVLAEPAGYVRVFLDEGEPLRDLLRRLLRRGSAATAAARLLRLFAPSGERTAHTAELLTPRERDVLNLLALGLPNRAIAERLVTSEATVKSHVHHLIDKLGVASRAEVLVRARELGELDPVTRPGGAG
jgi:LuxR family maltose regulon positive regulatory protein